MRGGKGGWWWKGILWAGGLLRPEQEYYGLARPLVARGGSSGGWHRLHVTEGGPSWGGSEWGLGSILWDSSLYLLRGLLLQKILWDVVCGRGSGAGGIIMGWWCRMGRAREALLPPPPPLTVAILCKVCLPFQIAQGVHLTSTPAHTHTFWLPQPTLSISPDQ